MQHWVDEVVKLNREPGSQHWGLFSAADLCGPGGHSSVTSMPLFPSRSININVLSCFRLFSLWNSSVGPKIAVQMWKRNHRQSHAYRITGLSFPMCVCCRAQEAVTNNRRIRILVQPGDELYASHLTTLSPNIPCVEKWMLARISRSQPWWHIRVVWEDVFKCWCPHPLQTH